MSRTQQQARSDPVPVPARGLNSTRHEPAEPQADREGESAADDDLNDRAAERAFHRAQTAASASSETARSGWIAAMRVRATNT